MLFPSDIPPADGKSTTRNSHQDKYRQFRVVGASPAKRDDYPHDPRPSHPKGLREGGGGMHDLILTPWKFEIENLNEYVNFDIAAEIKFSVETFIAAPGLVKGGVVLAMGCRSSFCHFWRLIIIRSLI